MALFIGGTDLLTAALIALGVYVGLPARWWPVDWAAALLTAIEVVAGMGLIAGAEWALHIARIASAIALAMGLCTVTTLAVTASWLSGIYGPVGHGGALILIFVAALVLPYLVMLPIAQLLWLGLRTVPPKPTRQ
jgi:hypothetical protein